MFKKISTKLKQSFCEHDELSDKIFTYKDPKYNENFDAVQIWENTHKVCLKCGKVIENPVVTWMLVKDVVEKHKCDEVEEDK